MSELAKEQKILDSMIESNVNYEDILKQSQLLDKYITDEFKKQFKKLKLTLK